MGIARRKAGTVVSCPNCSGQVVVPSEDGVETSGPEATAPPGPAGSQPLFERGDFDELFRSGKGMAPPPPPAQAPLPPPALAQKQPAPAIASPPPPPPLPAPMPPRPEVAPPLPGPPPPVHGYVISSSMATLLSVALVVALALAFTAGLLVGRFYLQPAEEVKPAPVEGLYKSDTPSRG